MGVFGDDVPELYLFECGAHHKFQRTEVLFQKRIVRSKAATLAVEKFTAISLHADEVKDSAALVSAAMSEQSNAGNDVLTSMQKKNK